MQARLSHLESVFQAPTDEELAAMHVEHGGAGTGSNDAKGAFDDAEGA